MIQGYPFPVLLGKFDFKIISLLPTEQSREIYQSTVHTQKIFFLTEVSHYKVLSLPQLLI